MPFVDSIRWQALDLAVSRVALAQTALLTGE